MAGKLIGSARSVAGNRPRRELTVLLLAGAIGAGLVLLGAREHLARVTVAAPRPLPATVTAITAQQVLPAVTALAVAALASLAAVLATRRWLRRVTGLITAALGVGIAVLALGQVTAAQVMSAANRTISPATGAEAGAAPGSVTAGGNGAGGGGLISGFPAHVVLTGAGWRYLMMAGAVIMVVAALVIVLRADRLPAMSARYDRHPAGSRRPGQSAAGPAPESAPKAAANMWELLSAGADPTADDGR